ncbi:protein CYCLOPS-like [Magnolia sinica]|uniref:protein CYCLOPS-like n=1 Tax=Magnolia sinica TaxID=86752 RepID=UPI002659A0E1|nr:protein CYCLOPS-like [Magnolia sinica]
MFHPLCDHLPVTTCFCCIIFLQSWVLCSCFTPSFMISIQSLRNVVAKGIQASNLYLAKAWFQSSQPMTRSQSSELRYHNDIDVPILLQSSNENAFRQPNKL